MTDSKRAHIKHRTVELLVRNNRQKMSVLWKQKRKMNFERMVVKVTKSKEIVQKGNICEKILNWDASLRRSVS